VQKALLRAKDEQLARDVKDKDNQIADTNKKAADANAEAAKANEGLAKSNEKIASLNSQAELLRAEAEKAREAIALAQVDAARANSEAAKANEKAEQERLARLKLEQQIAPRNLSSEQQARIASKLSSFVHERAAITWYPDSLEGGVLANQIASSLTAAHWSVNISADPAGINGMPTAQGVMIMTGSNEKSGAVGAALLEALQSVGKCRRAPCVDDARDVIVCAARSRSLYLPCSIITPEFSTLQISRMCSEEKLPQAWWEEEIAVDATIQTPIE